MIAIAKGMTVRAKLLLDIQVKMSTYSNAATMFYLWYDTFQSTALWTEYIAITTTVTHLLSLQAILYDKLFGSLLPRSFGFT